MTSDSLNISSEFPRKLSDFERECLFFVLPSNKKGYNDFRKKIESLFVIGYGRFGNSNLILGEKSAEIDPDEPQANIFALGNIKFREAEVYITLYEESDGQIEFDISEITGREIPGRLTEVTKWTYSTWIPGQKSPEGSKVREIYLNSRQLVLAVSTEHKKMWIYDGNTGIICFIPVTNFYDYLMRIKGVRDAKKALNSNFLFENPEEFSDQDIGAAFLVYNKFWKKIELDYSVFINHSKIEKGKPFLSFFKRG